MALFHALRSSSFLPPWDFGIIRLCVFIGGVTSEFHIKVLILFVNLFSISLGIPCTLVRYWVIPAIIICTISLLPSIVGWLFAHCCSWTSILSSVLDHTPDCSMLFPIHALKILVGSPSLAMWMFPGIGTWFGLSFLVSTTFLWYSGAPIGIISVFAILNLAPDAVHHLFSIICS